MVERQEVPVIETVMKFVDAFGRRSSAECLACFKQSDSLMTYGTAADEKRIGVEALREQFERDWSESLSATMQMTWHTSTAYENTGWVAADFIGRFKTQEAEGTRPIRATFVLERNEQSQWVIAHMHLSFPDVLTEEGKSFPATD